MTTPAAPVSTTADGNLKVTWVPAIANPGAPTVAELTAASAIDMTCYLTADGWSPGLDESVITDDRLCSRQTYEKPGRYTNTLSTTYVFRGQDIGAGITDNAAFKALKRGTTGFYVTRWGMAYETAYIAGQIVDVIPVQLGEQDKQPPEANSVHRLSQRAFVTNAVRRDVAVV
jgi:hypothetical protein